jgi:Sigma-70, region 4
MKRYRPEPPTFKGVSVSVQIINAEPWETGISVRRRNAMITLDHLCGMTYAALGRKWGISQQRVSQIVRQTLLRAKVKNHHDEAEARALVARSAVWWCPPRDTPEAFYNEVHDEKWGA